MLDGTATRYSTNLAVIKGYDQDGGVARVHTVRHSWAIATDLWTCARVQQVIEEKFGVTYHVDHVGRLLHSLGFSPQRPQRRARERNEAAIEHWRRYDWPRIKKGDRGSKLASFFSTRPASFCNR